MTEIVTPAQGQESSEKGIGPEKLSVRIFREVFARSAQKGGSLKADLDEYLRTVLTNKSAKRTDKSYARKIYTDLITRVGGVGLPDWAKKPEEAPLTDQDVTDILSSIEPKPEPPKVATPSGMAVEDIDLDSMLDDGFDKEPLDPFTSDSGALRPLLQEFLAKNEHPFIRPLVVNGEKFIVVGTVIGTIKSGKSEGKKINIHCTVNPHRRLRDVPEDIVLCRGGRQVSVTGEDPLGLRKSLYVVRPKEGLKIRFWMRINDEDQQGGARFIQLTSTVPDGFKRLTRSEF